MVYRNSRVLSSVSTRSESNHDTTGDSRKVSGLGGRQGTPASGVAARSRLSHFYPRASQHSTDDQPLVHRYQRRRHDRVDRDHLDFACLAVPNKRID